MKGSSKEVLRFFVFVICSCFLLPEQSNSQERNSDTATGTVAITGKVTDASTGKPLQDVNVFFANTFIGDATDKNGDFIIRKAPLGTHTLIVSMIGYEVKKESLRLTESKKINLDFFLDIKVISGPEIDITSVPVKDWKKNLKYFNSLFIGKSGPAGQCKIKNPEVLSFSLNKTKTSFTAKADDILIIENFALGYKLRYLLEEFVVTNNKINYKGIPLFEQLPPKNKNDEKKWKKNREKAYKGSQRHFLHSLINNRLKNEGFEILKRKGNRGPFIEETDIAGRMLSKGDYKFERKLHFRQFSVNYRRKKWPGGFTVVKANRNVITVHSSGYMYRPYEIFLNGYMGTKGIAELLPFEYSPPAGKK